MTIPTPNMNYSVATGANSNAGQLIYFSANDPTVNNINFPIGQLWINTSNGNVWILKSFSTTSGYVQATWIAVGTSLEDIVEHAILVGGSDYTINSIGPLTNGQLAIGSTGSDPVPATLTAGTGVSIVNGSGSITISTTGGGLTWNDVTTTSQTIVVNNGYTANSGSLITFTLPATAAYGTLFSIVGKGTGLFTIAQNSGQTIHFGNLNTTTGVGGSISSTRQYNVITCLCTVANTDWTVVDSMGSLTVV